MKRSVSALLNAAWMLPLLLSQVHADDAMRQRVQQQMQAPDRHRFDLPRDAGRKPYETFVFLGVQAGMTVIDVAAYAGYTSEMLAAAVGPQGRVYAHNTRRVLERYAEGYYQRTMAERLANDRLPNVTSHIAPYEDLGLVDAAGFDVVARSDLFANPDDSRELMVYDASIYRRTDRFLFKAVAR